MLHGLEQSLVSSSAYHGYIEGVQLVSQLGKDSKIATLRILGDF
jgi:hypothetical protein